MRTRRHAATPSASPVPPRHRLPPRRHGLRPPEELAPGRSRTGPHAHMATVYVNGQAVPMGREERLNCTQAADRAGVLIPSYCYDADLTVVASCRMCLVEIGEMKDGKPAM